jgi:flagellar protein FliS
MFQSALSASFGSSGFGCPQQSANAYRQVSVETGVASASPHHLVLMLYDGCLESIGCARVAMAGGVIDIKCAQISRAVRILEEGLIAGLDMQAGGEIAQNLRNLYSYAVVQLTRSNLRNDPALLNEVERLIRPLRDAWAAIGAKVSHGAAG